MYCVKCPNFLYYEPFLRETKMSNFDFSFVRSAYYKVYLAVMNENYNFQINKCIPPILWRYLQYFGGKTSGHREDMTLVAYVYFMPFMQRTRKTESIDSRLSGVDGK
jgi:hypothetical protein